MIVPETVYSAPMALDASMTTSVSRSVHVTSVDGEFSDTYSDDKFERELRTPPPKERERESLDEPENLNSVQGGLSLLTK